MIMSPTAPAAPRHLWIIDPKSDLLWFIGSCAFGYLILLLFAVDVPLTVIVPVWVLIDRSHVFCTATRTYLDRRERSRRKHLCRLAHR
jgi:hypothetical protein